MKHYWMHALSVLIFMDVFVCIRIQLCPEIRYSISTCLCMVLFHQYMKINSSLSWYEISNLKNHLMSKKIASLLQKSISKFRFTFTKYERNNLHLRHTTLTQTTDINCPGAAEPFELWVGQYHMNFSKAQFCIFLRVKCSMGYQY